MGGIDYNCFRLTDQREVDGLKELLSAYRSFLVGEHCQLNEIVLNEVVQEAAIYARSRYVRILLQ